MWDGMLKAIPCLHKTLCSRVCALLCVLCLCVCIFACVYAYECMYDKKYLHKLVLTRIHHTRHTPVCVDISYHTYIHMHITYIGPLNVGQSFVIYETNYPTY